jgi:hypothetical protein
MADGKISIEELAKLIDENSDNAKLKEAMKKMGVSGKATVDFKFDSGDVEGMRQRAEYLRLQAEYLNDIGDMEATREALNKNLKTLMEEQTKLGYNEEENKEALEEIEKLIKQVEEQAEKLNLKIGEFSPAAQAAQKAFTPMMSSLARKMGMVGKTQDTMTSKLMEGFKMLNSKDGIQGVMTSFTSVFSVINVAESIVLKFVESTVAMVKELDKATTSFAAATGAGDTFTGALVGAQQQGNLLGVTFDNAGNAIKGLFEDFVGFVDISEAGQAALIQDVALFERIGINAQTSGKMLTTFTKNMDMSATGAMNMTKSLAQMGDQIGISAQKMMSDFQAAFKSLAVYGDQSIEVFQGLSAAAKAAGVEVGTLMAITGKFDTFQGAAEAVGKLNALLGSQISSTEMLMMTEDKRIETLIQQVQLSGTNFKDMNKFEQMAIANAAGISDMSEAQRIFGMSFNDYGKYKDRMQAQKNVQENFNKAIEATIPFTEKLAMFAREFAVALQPLHYYFGLVLDLMLGFATIGDGMLIKLIGIVSTFTLFYKLLGLVLPLKKLFTALSGKFTTFLAAENVQQEINNKVKQEQIPTNELLSGTQTQLGATSKFAAGGLMQIAGALALVAVGVGVAAFGLSYFVEAFQGMDSKQLSAINNALLGFGLVFLSLVLILALVAPKIAIAGTALYYFGGAIALIGLGIGVAAVGMGYMAEKIAMLAEHGVVAIDVMTGLVGLLAQLSMIGGAGLLGTAGAVVQLATLAIALKEIADIMEESEPLQAGLGNLALVVTGKTASNMTESAVTAVSELKSAFSGLMEQKITISLKIADGEFSKMIEDVVINGINSDSSSDGKIRTAVINAVASTGG